MPTCCAAGCTESEPLRPCLPLSPSLEELAARDTLLTRLSPLAKLLSVLFYLAVTLSFPQAALSGLLGMALYPCLLYPLGDLPLRRALGDFRFLLPVPLFLGLVPALFGKFSALLLAVLVLKSLLAFLAVFLLAASTGMYALTASLARLHAPRLFTTSCFSATAISSCCSERAINSRTPMRSARPVKRRSLRVTLPR